MTKEAETEGFEDVILCFHMHAPVLVGPIVYLCDDKATEYITVILSQHESTCFLSSGTLQKQHSEASSKQTIIFVVFNLNILTGKNNV